MISSPADELAQRSARRASLTPPPRWRRRSGRTRRPTSARCRPGSCRGRGRRPSRRTRRARGWASSWCSAPARWAFTCTPPKVKVMPPVTGYAMNGGVSSRCAQFDFGSASPSVASPSRTVGSNAPGSTAALYASSVSRHARPVDRQLLDQAASESAIDRLARLVAPLEQARDLVVEDLVGDAARLVEDDAAELGVRVELEVLALVEEAPAVDVDQHAVADTTGGWSCRSACGRRGAAPRRRSAWSGSRSTARTAARRSRAPCAGRRRCCSACRAPWRDPTGGRGSARATRDWPRSRRSRARPRRAVSSREAVARRARPRR